MRRFKYLNKKAEGGREALENGQQSEEQVDDEEATEKGEGHREKVYQFLL